MIRPKNEWKAFSTFHPCFWPFSRSVRRSVSRLFSFSSLDLSIFDFFGSELIASFLAWRQQTHWHIAHTHIYSYLCLIFYDFKGKEMSTKQSTNISKLNWTENSLVVQTTHYTLIWLHESGKRRHKLESF